MAPIPAADRRARPWLWRGLAILALVAVGTVMDSCGSSPTAPGGNTNTPTPPTNNPQPTGPILSGTGVLIGAGDIADCDNGIISPGLIATTKLMDGLAGTGTVFTAGDNAYLNGDDKNYSQCYAPYWGRFKDRTWPVPGNHEYISAGAMPYYNYFGADVTGLPTEGYWLRTLGTWTILGLNSERNLPGQIAWFTTQLSNPANKTPCTLAIWHRPRFSSGSNGNQTDMQGTWKALYDLGVDVIVNGHDHVYEMFEPQDGNGNRDLAKGMRQFTVGTGGVGLTGIVNLQPNSAVRINEWGVVKFTLKDNSTYSWDFIPALPGRTGDSGSDKCH